MHHDDGKGKTWREQHAKTIQEKMVYNGTPVLLAC